MEVELTPDLEARLRELSEAVHLSPEELVDMALTSYLERVKLLRDEVREGEESANREGWLMTSEVFERLHRRAHTAA